MCWAAAWGGGGFSRLLAGAGNSYIRGGPGERVERLSREVRAYAVPGGSEEILLDLSVRQVSVSLAGSMCLGWVLTLTPQPQAMKAAARAKL